MPATTALFVTVLPFAAMAAAAATDATGAQGMDLPEVRWHTFPEDVRRVLFGPDGRAWFTRRVELGPDRAAFRRRVEAACAEQVPWISGADLLLLDRRGRVWCRSDAEPGKLLGDEPAAGRWQERAIAGPCGSIHPWKVWQPEPHETAAGRLFFVAGQTAHVLDGDTWTAESLVRENDEHRLYNGGRRAFNPFQFVEDTRGNVYAWSGWQEVGWTGSVGCLVHDGRGCAAVDGDEPEVITGLGEEDMREILGADRAGRMFLPGRERLHAWHPRFPETRRSLPTVIFQVPRSAGEVGHDSRGRVWAQTRTPGGDFYAKLRVDAAGRIWIVEWTTTRVHDGTKVEDIAPQINAAVQNRVRFRHCWPMPGTRGMLFVGAVVVMEVSDAAGHWRCQRLQGTANLLMEMRMDWSGGIGLDSQGRIWLPNDAASAFVIEAGGAGVRTVSDAGQLRFEDAAGRVWFATGKDFVVLDREGRRTRAALWPDARLADDGAGSIWSSALDGLEHWSVTDGPEGPEVKPVARYTKDTPGGGFLDMFVDERHRLWCFSHGPETYRLWRLQLPQPGPASE